MSDPNEFSVSAVNRKRAQAAAPAAAIPHAVEAGLRPAPAAGGLALPFDPWRVAAAVISRWWLLLLAGALAGSAGLGFGVWRFERSYTATAQFMKQEVPSAFRVSDIGESFRPRQMSVPTLVSLMKSLSLLERANQRVRAKLSPRALLGGLTITPERNTDLIKVSLVTSLGAQPTMELLNAFGAEVVQMSCAMQVQEAGEIGKFLKQQLARSDRDLELVNRELLAFSQQARLVNADKELDAQLRKLGDLDLKYETMRLDFDTLDLKMEALVKELAHHSPMAAQLQAAKTQLATLLTSYTETNPLVQSQHAQIAKLEKQVLESSGQLSTPRPGEIGVAATLYMELVSLKSQKQVLAAQLKQLTAVRETVTRQMDGLPEKSMQYGRIKARQQSLETARGLLASRQHEAQLFEDSALGYLRFFDAKPQDVETGGRSTKILAVAIACAVLVMLLTATVIGLVESFDDRIKTAADVKRVTGLPMLASLPPFAGWEADRIETWAFRTLTGLQSKLSAGPGRNLICGFLSAGAGEGRSTWTALLAQAAGQRGARTIAIANATPPETTPIALADALENPALLAQAPSDLVWLLAGTDWQWTAERRRQWQAALPVWMRGDGWMVLVELGAACMPDTLLMAELMPNLIWLTGSGQARVRETRELLETFRQAGCRFAGAALNREPCLRVPFAPRAAWLLVALCLSSSLWAAETPVALSAAHVSRKAAWQQRFTLGPGDALNFSLYGRPELARSEIYVDPSGCVTYLQATGVKAAGLTIDELRAKMDAELSKYYQNARVIIMPFAFHSKKFYVLGKVNIKGAFEMDRPVTLVEAVAMAGGLETGLFELNTVELADLPRSFLVRQNKRMPVDFEKLFFQGDLSQNVLIEPDDYLYFPSSNVNEIYLLGEVLRPGAQGLTANASVVSVVSLGGGFSKKAYRQKVLVVRGSLNKPESFVVNVAAVLEGKMPDFKLQPRDIVFVSSRPWSRAEELLDMAATAFVQAAVTTWTGAYIGPFITKPVLPVP